MQINREDLSKGFCAAAAWKKMFTRALKSFKRKPETKAGNSLRSQSYSVSPLEPFQPPQDRSWQYKCSGAFLGGQKLTDRIMAYPASGASLERSDA
jgi:hypothetical protein